MKWNNGTISIFYRGKLCFISRENAKILLKNYKIIIFTHVNWTISLIIFWLIPRERFMKALVGIKSAKLLKMMKILGFVLHLLAHSTTIHLTMTQLTNWKLCSIVVKRKDFWNATIQCIFIADWFLKGTTNFVMSFRMIKISISILKCTIKKKNRRRWRWTKIILQLFFELFAVLSPIQYYFIFLSNGLKWYFE